MSNPDYMADYVLEKLGISVVEDLLLLDEIVYARGAILHECSMEGSEARLLLGPGKPIISVSSSPLIDPHRRRFSIAHELGHLEMHRGKNLMKSCTTIDIQESTNTSINSAEHEANQFASAFLIPERFVKIPFSKSEPSFDVINDWATKLRTSITSTSLRFTQFTCEPIAVIYSFRGTIKYFRSSSEFEDLGVFPKVNSFVGVCTGASKLFSGQKIPQRWQEVRASQWFRNDENAFDRNDTIREWSIGMPNFEAVLSLLWVNEPLGQNCGW